MPEWDELLDWIRECTGRVGLSHWTIEVLLKNEAGSYAEVVALEGSEIAELTIQTDAFSSLSRSQQRRVLAHEFGHVLLANLLYAVGRIPGVSAFESVITSVEELTVDRLAGTIAKTLPLPPIGE